MTASTQAGDKTTWLGRGLNGHGKAEDIPRAEEEDTLAGLAAERGGVSLLTKDSGGKLWPSLGNRPGETKLQKLPGTALDHHRLGVFLILFLATMAGREEEEHQEATNAALKKASS